jgi:hypothetical protein
MISKDSFSVIIIYLLIENHTILMPASFSGVDYEENEFPRQDGSQKPTRSKNESITFRIYNESITKLRK